MKSETEQFYKDFWWNPWTAFYIKWLQNIWQKNQESVMRKYIRHPSDMPLDFQVSDHAPCVDQRVKDVSVGGLCFTTPLPVQQGSRIHIHIPLLLQNLADEAAPAEQQEFDADGVVAWCRPEGSGYAVGVQFADESTQFGLRMVEQICHIEHYRYDVLQGEGRNLSSEEAAREWVERFAAEFPH